MEAANRFITAAGKYITAAANNDTVVNVFLGGVFGVLCLRSVEQQKQIDQVETQRDTLLEKNKAMRKLMWDWKQKLSAEAANDSFPVSLGRIKAIYGEASISQNTGDAAKQDAKPPAPKLLI